MAMPRPPSTQSESAREPAVQANSAIVDAASRLNGVLAGSLGVTGGLGAALLCLTVLVIALLRREFEEFSFMMRYMGVNDFIATIASIKVIAITLLSVLAAYCSYRFMIKILLIGRFLSTLPAWLAVQMWNLRRRLARQRRKGTEDDLKMIGEAIASERHLYHVACQELARLERNSHDTVTEVLPSRDSDQRADGVQQVRETCSRSAQRLLELTENERRSQSARGQAISHMLSIGRERKARIRKLKDQRQREFRRPVIYAGFCAIYLMANLTISIMYESLTDQGAVAALKDPSNGNSVGASTICLVRDKELPPVSVPIKVVAILESTIIGHVRSERSNDGERLAAIDRKSVGAVLNGRHPDNDDVCKAWYVQRAAPTAETPSLATAAIYAELLQIKDRLTPSKQERQSPNSAGGSDRAGQIERISLRVELPRQARLGDRSIANDIHSLVSETQALHRTIAARPGLSDRIARLETAISEIGARSNAEKGRRREEMMGDGSIVLQLAGLRNAIEAAGITTALAASALVDVGLTPRPKAAHPLPARECVPLWQVKFGEGASASLRTTYDIHFRHNESQYLNACPRQTEDAACDSIGHNDQKLKQMVNDLAGLFARDRSKSDYSYIALAGEADTRGTPPHNLVLSKVRADSVCAKMIVSWPTERAMDINCPAGGNRALVDDGQNIRVVSVPLGAAYLFEDNGVGAEERRRVRPFVCRRAS